MRNSMYLHTRHAVHGLLTFTLLLASLSVLRADTTASDTPPKWYDTFKFSGYIQFDATFPDGNSPYGNISNFRIRRMRPTFSVQIDPLTRVQLQFEAATGKSGATAANMVFTDNFIERKVPGLCVIQAGNTVIPFSREVGELGPPARIPLELSYISDTFNGGERDLGVFAKSLTTDKDKWTWGVALVNGQGTRVADANANVTFIGTAAYRINPNLRIGMSNITGTFRAAGNDYDHDVTGYEIQAAANKALMLSGELYHVKFVNSVTAATPSVAHYEGGYLLLQSWIGSVKSIPFVRYQRTYGDIDYQSYDLGWRWQYTAAQCFTAEYDIVKGDQRNMFGCRWQVSF